MSKFHLAIPFKLDIFYLLVHEQAIISMKY